MPIKADSHALSTLVLVLVITILVGIVVVATAIAVFFGLWHPLGHVVGSGSLATEPKDFTDFSTVEAGWGFKVRIDHADSHSVEITADDNMFDYIEISQTGDTLTIGLKWGYSYQNMTLRADITMPQLYELRFSGGTHGSIEGFTSSHEFKVELSGGSHLSGGFTTSDDAQFALSGGSHLVELEGAARNLRISASGGSRLGLLEFSVHNSTINLSGGSSATINLDGSLDGNLSGGSHLKYLGDPTVVDVNTSGGSTVGPQ